jgi:hypothetical protein
MGALLAIQELSLLGAAAEERNVALASEGSVATVSSSTDALEGGQADTARLIDGKWMDNMGGDQRGQAWVTYLHRKAPHWAWIALASPRRIDRVVLHCSSLENYPIAYRIQTSDDAGVTVKDLAVVTNQPAPRDQALAMEARFAPVTTDNVRILIERSGSLPGFPHAESAQLAEIEVFGSDDAPSALAPAAHPPAAPLPSRMLQPRSEKNLRIDETDEQVTVLSQWQKLVLDKRWPAIRFLAWDSEGQGRLQMDLLQTNGLRPWLEPAFGRVLASSPVPLERHGNVFRYAPVAIADGVSLAWEIRVGPRTVDMALARYAARNLTAKPGMIRLGMSGAQTACLPYYKPGQIGQVGLPLLLHAVDEGPVLLTSPDKSLAGFAWRGREYGAPQLSWINLDLAEAWPERADGLTLIQPGLWRGQCSWRVEPVTPLNRLVAADPRLRKIGFSRFMLNGMPFRADSHLLANSPTSINCGFCMFEYADMAAFLPPLPGGIDATDLLRTTFDYYTTGSCDAYTGYRNIHDPDFRSPPDTKPALLIAAWTVVRKTGDMELLHRWLPHVERLAALMEETDADGDGLLETVKTTKGGGWYDTIPSQDKCAYGNAMAYRAFGLAADLARLAGKPDKAQHYELLARRIRSAYLPAFRNPATGVLCAWRTKDGVYHDHWFPWVNGMAIGLGLVPDREANEILDRFQAKFKAAGFTRFDLGLPNCLEPMGKDYGQNEKGEPAHPFKYYLHGGVTPCFSYHYIQALYRLYRRAEADAILLPMLSQFDRGRFNGGAECRRTPHIDPETGATAVIGREWSDWDGNPQTGEGYLPDCYHVLGALWTGHYGIIFDPQGYELAPWSPLKGQKAPLGLTYMGKVVKTVK